MTVLPGSTVTVSRDEELARLRDDLVVAQAGGGRLLVITGEAGIGKSKLLADTGHRAADRGMAVLSGRAVAGRVLQAWRAWVAGLPDEMASCARLLRFPPLPHIPEPVRGRPFAVVEAVHLGSAADTDKLLAPLRRLRQAHETVRQASLLDLLTIHMDPPGPVPGVGDGMLLDELPAEAVDALVASAGPGSGSRLLSVELRHLGGGLRPG